MDGLPSGTWRPREQLQCGGRTRPPFWELASGDGVGLSREFSMNPLYPFSDHSGNGSDDGIARYSCGMMLIQCRHGKDNKLVVWKMREEDEVDMSKTLPVDDTGSGKEAERKMPWILHILEVNTLNFCSFASCRARGTFGDSSAVGSEGGDDNDDDGLLIAVPNAITSEAVSFLIFLSSCLH